jgi:hypothetical protein
VFILVKMGVIMVCESGERKGWSGVEEASLGGGGGGGGWCIHFCCVGYVFVINSNMGFCIWVYVSTICSVCMLRLCM